MECPFCAGDGGEILFADGELRIVLADEPDYPGFTRVIWNGHCAEMSDLPDTHRSHLMNTVFRVEAAMRQILLPAKVNLASLGNQVPHIHWHVIARYADDPTFPAPVWAPAVRAPNRSRLVGPLNEYRQAIAAF